MNQKSFSTTSSLNSKSAFLLSSNRSPRSNSRKRTSTASGPAVIAFAEKLKPSSFFSQALTQSGAIQTPNTSSQANQSVFLANGLQDSQIPYQNHNSSQQLTPGPSSVSYTPAYNSSIIGQQNPLSLSQSQQYQSVQVAPLTPPVSPFKLLCRKHDKPIEKICTKIGCEQQVVLCSDCYFDSQQHIGLHKDHMFSYDDFISVCRSFSLRHKDDFTSGSGRQLAGLLAKLERSVQKYKTHVKKEEEKIDADFDFLISEFTKDIEEIKLKLKSSFTVSLDKFVEMSKSLKIKAHDLQQEKESNLDNKNDFDDFLKNIKEITAVKQNTTQNYNFKKLISNISPLLTRYKDQIQKLIANGTSAQNVVINTEQSETLSCFTGVTGITSFTLNLAAQPHLAPIKDLFSDFKELSANKPTYKNKGEGQKLYSDSLADLKRIYHDLLENQSLFIQSSKPKLALEFNKENLEALTIPEKPEIDELQFIQKTDNITLNDDQFVSKIDFIKSVNTAHKAGIFSLVIVDDDSYVTGSSDRTVKVFGLKDHRLIKEIRFNSDITALSTLQRNDGSMLVLVGLYGGFAVLSQSFEIMKMMEGEHEASVNCVIGLKDSQTVITASSDPKIVVWNVFNSDIHNRKYFDHKDTIYSLELFPCEKFLASGGRDRTIKVWRLQYYKDNFRNGVLEKMILDTNISEAHSTDITALKASKLCKNILFSGSANGEVKIWELEDATCVKTIKNSSGWVYKFIVFERQQSLETDKLLENSENAISHVSYASPSKSKIQSVSAKKSISGYPSAATSSSSYSSNQSISIQQSQGNTAYKTRMVSPVRHNSSITPSSLLNPSSASTISQKKLKAKKHAEQLKKIQFLTASFDGTLKLWNASSDIPIDSQKSKHSFDCFPFGAVTVFQKDDEARIQVLTTGNKNDTSINIWNIN